MPFSRALKASLALAFFVAALSLFNTEVAWAVAEVESRSHGSNWSRQSGQEQNPSLELIQKMEFLQQEVQELRGKVEEQTYQLQQLQEHQKKLYLDLDRRVREGSGATKTSATSGITLEIGDENPTIASTAVGNSQPTSEQKVAEESAYRNAYHLVQTKDYEGAISAFNALIVNHPHGKYLPNAQYWLGEIYMSKKDLDAAEKAFNTVYQNHPQHPKAADSLLKLGYIAYGKAQYKNADALLNQVKTQFPGSTAAQLAESRQQRMKQEGHL